jgi:hypothetical protein
MSRRRYQQFRQQQDPLALLERARMLEEEFGPAGMRDTMKSYIRANPDLRDPFDYQSLEEKYPLKSIQSQIEAEEDMMIRAEDLNYRKSLIQERLSEVELKKTARDLDMFESRINREDAMLEQVPLARQALGELDPRDPEYIRERMKVFNEYPLAFEYEPFINTVDKPLLERHQRTANARSVIDEGRVGLREYQSAINEISKYASIRENRDLSQAELDYLSDMEAIFNQYRAQQGAAAMPQEEPPLSPEPTEDMAEPQPVNIPPPEEDDDIYAEAMDVISRNPELKDAVNQRLIQMGRKPIQ